MQKKMYRYEGFVFSAIFIFVGILLIALPYLDPQSSYIDLKTKNVIVDNIKFIHVYRSSYYRLTTKSGEKYQISGSYKEDELLQYVQPNTTVIIKYYSSSLFFRSIIEELNVEGKSIVTYVPIQKSQQIGGLIGGLFVISFGGCGLFIVRFTYLNDKRKRKMRIIKLKKNMVKHIKSQGNIN